MTDRMKPGTASSPGDAAVLALVDALEVATFALGIAAGRGEATLAGNMKERAALLAHVEALRLVTCSACGVGGVMDLREGRPAISWTATRTGCRPDHHAPVWRVSWRVANAMIDAAEEEVAALQEVRDAVCDEHARMVLTGKAVEGFIGCPWCMVASLRARADTAERERDATEERMRVVLYAGPSTALATAVYDRAIRAERERDSLRARLLDVTVAARSLLAQGPLAPSGTWIALDRALASGAPTTNSDAKEET